MTQTQAFSLKCGVCGCVQNNSRIITEIQLEVISKYIHEDGRFEDMNGLWKKTSEFLCADCFKEYTQAMMVFYNSRRKLQA